MRREVRGRRVRVALGRAVAKFSELFSIISVCGGCFLLLSIMSQYSTATTNRTSRKEDLGGILKQTDPEAE